MKTNLPKEIFKAYDIRGVVGKSLTPEVVEAIGHAIGSEATARKQHTIAIGRDGRLSGPELIAALARGIQKVVSMSLMLVVYPHRWCILPLTSCKQIVQ